MSFMIANIEIGIDNKPLVIPDIGINQNGSIDIAKLMGCG